MTTNSTTTTQIPITHFNIPPALTITMQNIALWRKLEDEQRRREAFNKAVINECWILDGEDNRGN